MSLVVPQLVETEFGTRSFLKGYILLARKNLCSPAGMLCVMLLKPEAPDCRVPIPTEA